LELDGREDWESFCFLEGTLGIAGRLGEGWEQKGRKEEEVELNEIFAGRGPASSSPSLRRKIFTGRE